MAELKTIGNRVVAVGINLGEIHSKFLVEELLSRKDEDSLEELDRLLAEHFKKCLKSNREATPK